MGTMKMQLNFYDKLEQAILANQAFVLLRKPHENQVFLYVQDHSDEQKVIFHSFDSKIERVISDQCPSSILEVDFDIALDIQLNKNMVASELTKSAYERVIDETIRKIENSNIRKIVMSRRKVHENQGYHVLKSYRNLLRQQPTALVFLWHFPGHETWLGATPELLLSQKNNHLKTVSLAATKLPTAEWSEKEFDEQQIVTDFILNCFEGIERVKTIGPETVQVGQFQHLKTYVSGDKPENFPIESLLEKLHPTPALCGLPKKDAFEYIVHNEGYPREFYAGYIGLVSKNTQEYFVNLRSAQLHENQIWLYVGGGITKESVPENEWSETELKAGTILNALVK